jgi:hypothetical protein
MICKKKITSHSKKAISPELAHKKKYKKFKFFGIGINTRKI